MLFLNSPGRLLPFVLLPVLLAGVFLVYFPGLSGGFFFDDHVNILDNPNLRLFQGTLSSLVEASAGGVAGPGGRPLSMASFAFNLYLSGFDPFYFKLLNLLIHLANGVLIYVMVRLLWPDRQAGNDRGRGAALWVGAVWLLHPLNLSPVLFVVQRMTSLSAFFTLLAVCAYLIARRSESRFRWAILAPLITLLWVAAILAKEIGVLLPVYLLVLEWTGLVKGTPITRKVLGWVALAGSGLAMAICWWYRDRLMGGYEFRDFSLVERLMTEARVLWYHVMQLFCPVPNLFALHHDDLVISKDLLSPWQTLPALFAWGLVVLYSLTMRRGGKALQIAVLWFLGGHLLESTILPLEPMHEHRNYLPGLGLILGTAMFLFPLGSGGNGPVLRKSVAVGFVALCAFTTFLRASQWGDESRRTMLEAAQQVDSPRANYEAGLTMLQRTVGSGVVLSPFAYQFVQYHFRRAADLDANDRKALIGLLYLDCAAGLQADSRIYSQLRDRLAHGRYLPGDQGVIHSLSPLLVENRLCLTADQVDGLVDALLSNHRASGAIRGRMHGVAKDYALVNKGSLPLALHHAMAAVAVAPGNVSSRIDLALLLLKSGKTEDARGEFARIDPASVRAGDRDSYGKLASHFGGGR